LLLLIEALEEEMVGLFNFGELANSFKGLFHKRFHFGLDFRERREEQETMLFGECFAKPRKSRSET